jgi:hypothetical protein
MARLHRILIPLAAFLATLPLLIQGPSCGHDFDFHILSWLEAATQFAHLHYPHWAYTPAFNAGEPRFIFYPPLSWSLGALLGLVLPWTLVPAAFTFVCLTLSGFTAHRLAAQYAKPYAATLAAVLYLSNPYMLFTAYERTAYGELLAAAFLPLLLRAALAPRLRIEPLALPIALLWLSNAPAGVMSCYALAFLILLRLLQRAEFQTRPQVARTAIFATVLGLTLSAFYLVPAAYEQKYIQASMATIAGMRIVDNTLFHHMAPVTEDTLAHDVVLHAASLVAMLLAAGVVLALLLSGRVNRRRLVPVALLTLLIAFLLTPLSLPLWTHLPELRFLQFPWRLTAILGSVLALIAASAFDRLKLTAAMTTAGAMTLSALLILPAWHLFHQPCDDEDTVQARVGLYHSRAGTDPTDEYTPTGADNDALAHSDPPFWLSANPNACDQPAPAASRPGQAPRHLTLDLPAPELLILNRRAFPDWQVSVNGTPASSCGRDDGLLAINLPAGPSVVEVTSTTTPDQAAGIALSLLSAATLAGMSAKRRISSTNSSS